MVLVCITTPIPDGDFPPDLVMVGFPCPSILILLIGGHVVTVMVIVTVIITAIIVAITMATEPVMPGGVTIQEMYTEEDLLFNR